MEGFIQKYSQKLQENSIPGQNGECLIWTGACTPNGKYGVINCKLPDARGWRQMHAHRLAYMLQHRIIQLPDSDVSHLCHNTKCINVEHLVLERHGFNNSRQTCISCGRCLGHVPPCRINLKMPNNDIGIFYFFSLFVWGGGQGSLFFLFFFFLNWSITVKISFWKICLVLKRTVVIFAAMFTVLSSQEASSCSSPGGKSAVVADQVGLSCIRVASCSSPCRFYSLEDFLHFSVVVASLPLVSSHNSFCTNIFGP